MSALLSVEGLVKRFGTGRGERTVLDGLGFDVHEGESLGLVGESGSGKSTTIRCVVGLERPQAGSVVYDGLDVRRLTFAQERRFRSEVQMVFQDPYSSLDPRMDVGTIVGEPLSLQRGISAAQRRDRIVEALEQVGLDAQQMRRHPRSFSGGQRQRIAIARALVTRPRLLICDEPVSALDVSVQAQVLNLLKDMQRQLSLTLLFIAHDLAVVRYLCDRVIVLRDGAIVEEGRREQIYGAPQHPYTRELLEAVPRADPRAERERRARRRAADPTTEEGNRA
ncbi:MAG: ATP-binding cassette domain-containing protein [Microbacterium sp.]|uniref:ATP-binding cassette domain-containing protein n=1 Tax=Microbacterium sp. TaxID=51671 RepID=UPI0039E47144